MPIAQTLQQDVLGTDLPIVFAVNAEGYNDAGFAGVIARRYWPELAETGPQVHGTVLKCKTDDGRTFLGVVCHSLDTGEWDLSAITAALDRIADEGISEAAVVWMGKGIIGHIQGVDPEQTKAAIAASRLITQLYHL